MNREVRTAHWQQKMDEFQASKQTAKSWCADNGIALPTFHYWKKKLTESVGTLSPGKEEICWLELSPKSLTSPAQPAGLVVQVGPATPREFLELRGTK